MRFKSLLLLVLIFQIGIHAMAQQTDSLLYKRFPTVPPFNLQLAPDSAIFNKDLLKKNKPTLFFIFSPDCGHCQLTTADLLKHYQLFKNYQIIMATPVEYKWILPFYQEYKLKNFPAIKIGRDASHSLGTFFNVKNFPELFLYNAKGTFVKEFKGTINFQEIANYLK